MYCPKCRIEFRAGFTECSDCRVPLVQELEPHAADRTADADMQLVTAWSTFDPLALAVAKSLLDDAGILYFAGNENFLRLTGYSSPLMGWSPAFGQFDLQVRADDADAAAKLLEQIEEVRTIDRFQD